MDLLDDAHTRTAAADRSNEPSSSMRCDNASAANAEPLPIKRVLATNSVTTDTSINTNTASSIAPPMATPPTDLLAHDAIECNDDADAKKREVQLGRELFVFTAQKAGMHDVDRERVQQVVFDISKDSKFFQNSLKQNDKVDARIAAMQRRLAALTDATRTTLERRVDALVAQLEATRDLTRTVVVVDMDMFYAAVEMRDDPKLRDVPLAVGGTSMICTTNYIARTFGVRAAMPGFIGKELCPSLVVVPPNFAKYKAVAATIRSIFAVYDPHFTSCSLDEARLDITEYMDTHWREYVDSGSNDASATDAHGHSSRHGERDSASDDEDDDKDVDDSSDALDERDRVRVAAAVVNEIRRKIHEQTELTASAGVAANTMLAKIASDMNKPNGQFVLPFTRDAVVSFIASQPVRKIGGIGKVMEKILAALGVTTGAELFAKRIELFHVFASTKTAPWLLRTSLAIQHVREARPRKSFSRERTFRSLSDAAALETKCRAVCASLADDLARANAGARTLTLKLKCADFSVRSRSVSFATTLRTASDLVAGALALLRKELPLTLRLLGVRASALVTLADDSSGSRGDGSERKRQLGIDRFAVATASADADCDAECDDADDASGDRDCVLTADESTDDAGVAADSDRMQQRTMHSGAMARYVTALDKDATSDIVAAMLATSALGAARDGVQSDASTNARSATAPAIVRAASVSPSSPVASSFQPCPICSKTINASNAIAISTHVDACIRKQQSRQSPSPWQRPSSRSTKRVRSSESLSLFDALARHEPCPICGDLIDASSSRLVNMHIDACIASSTLATVDDVDADADVANAPVVNTSDNNNSDSNSNSRCDSRDTVEACPICGITIDMRNEAAASAHVDACAERSSKQQRAAHSGDERESQPKRRRRGLGSAAQHSIRSFFAANE